MNRPTADEMRVKEAEYLANRRKRKQPEEKPKRTYAPCPGCNGNLTALDVPRGRCGSCAAYDELQSRYREDGDE